jgi:hypothetical protein
MSTEQNGKATESMTARTSSWDAQTLRDGETPGSRSRGFAPNPVEHVRAAQAATRLVVVRELERTASRAGLR